MKRLWVLLFLFAGIARAQTVTVTGNLYDVGVNPVTANTIVTFELQNFGGDIPRIVGGGPVIAQIKKTFSPDNSGTFSGTVYDNTFVQPAGTWYSVCIIPQGAVLRCDNYVINGPGTWNLATATPMASVPNVGPSQVIVQAYPCPGSGTTWTCVHNFNDTNVFVQVLDSNHHQIIPDAITVTDANTVTLTFVTATSGTAIIMHAGSISIATNQPNAILSNPTAPQTITTQPLTVPSLTVSGIASGNCVQTGTGGLLTGTGGICGSGGGGGTVTTTGSPASGQLAKFSGATSITTALIGDIPAGTSGQCLVTLGTTSQWGSCAGTAGVQLIAQDYTYRYLSAAVLTPQNFPVLYTFSAGQLNTLGKRFTIDFHGVVQLQNTSVLTTLNVSLDSTAYYAGANFPSTNINATLESRITCVTVTTGTFGQLHCAGITSFTDQNGVTVVRPTDETWVSLNLTLSHTLNWSINFSTASTSNVGIQEQGLVYLDN